MMSLKIERHSRAGGNPVNEKVKRGLSPYGRILNKLDTATPASYPRGRLRQYDDRLVTSYKS